jgi:RNA polymerase sigma-70 factor (ECF subfamily)
VQFDPNDPAFVPDDDAPTADRVVLDSERMAKVAQAIETLPPEQSEIVRKAFFEDKTHLEISKETNIPLGTVKSRIRLALERLRPQLGQEYL